MPAETRAQVRALFNDAETLVASVRRVRERGFSVCEVFTPYAVHELDDALGLERSRLGWVTLAGGLFGGLSAIAIQVWTSAVDWPLDVGGKPPLSPLAFLPVTFELTVLCAGLATAGAFLWKSRLYPGQHPGRPTNETTNDRFALVAAASAHGETDLLRRLLADAGATEVREVIP